MAAEAKKAVLTAAKLKKLCQEIPLSEILVRQDGTPNNKGRTRCVAYVQKETVQRVLTEADPDWELRSIETGFLPPRQDGRAQTAYAVCELTVCGVTRTGTGENDGDKKSPGSTKGAASDAFKRAFYQFGGAHQLMTDGWYIEHGLPGPKFYCVWPDQWTTAVPMEAILNGERAKYQPGPAWGPPDAPKPAPNGSNGGSPSQTRTPRQGASTKPEVIAQIQACIEAIGVKAADITEVIGLQFGEDSAAALNLGQTKVLRDFVCSCKDHAEFSAKLKELIASKAEEDFEE